MRKSINVFYWDGMKNFGDALNPIIAEKIFNTPIKNSTPQNCEAVFIGSLLDDFLYAKFIPWYKFSSKNKDTKVKIWGTGFIDNKNKYVKRPFNLSETFFRNVEVYAVRGKYSKNRLEKITKQCLNNTVLGDPGLLASMLISNSKCEKKYDIGFIPHHLEIHGFSPRLNISPEEEGLIPNNLNLYIPIYKHLKNKCSNAVIIDMEASPMKIIEKVAECKTIVSSALHGLILADSLGIPNLWSTASDLLIGKDYKFKDYYSAYDIENPLCLDLNSLSVKLKDLPQYIINNYAVEQSKCLTIKKKLLNSFPYKEDS